MGQQYNKVQKQRRRKSYLQRKKDKAKAGRVLRDADNGQPAAVR